MTIESNRIRYVRDSELGDLVAVQVGVDGDLVVVVEPDLWMAPDPCKLHSALVGLFVRPIEWAGDCDAVTKGQLVGLDLEQRESQDKSV